jgi:hypothetical protein
MFSDFQTKKITTLISFQNKIKNKKEKEGFYRVRGKFR